jgi:nucleotide-binding universal stress UspA family protein
MPRFKKILFPVDLSEASPQVAPYVGTMAEKFNARVYLLYVARVLHHYATLYVPDPSIYNFERELLDGAKKRLYEFRDEHFKEFEEVKVEVLLGDAAGEILQFAEKENIDLIIMGTHGRQGLDKIVFGSVADRVVKSSPAPVMVVSPFTHTFKGTGRDSTPAEAR